MTTKGRRITPTDMPKAGDCIVANGKTYIAMADAYWHPNLTPEHWELDEMGEWIGFHVYHKDEWMNPEDVIYFDKLLMCRCHAEGKDILLFWDGQPSFDWSEKGKWGSTEIHRRNGWATFS